MYTVHGEVFSQKASIVNSKVFFTQLDIQCRRGPPCRLGIRFRDSLDIRTGIERNQYARSRP